jgi:hypothetical protein
MWRWGRVGRAGLVGVWWGWEGGRDEGLVSIRRICGGGGWCNVSGIPFGSALNYHFFTVSPFLKPRRFCSVVS